MFSANTRPHQLCWGALASSSDSLLPPFLRREPGDEARGAWEMGTGVSCKNCCKMTAYSGVGTALRLCDELLLWAVTEFTLYNMHMCVLPLVHSLAIIALVESIQQHEINWRKKELEIVPASYGIKQVFKDDNIRWLEGKMNKTGNHRCLIPGDYPLTSHCVQSVYTPHSQEVVKAATLCNYITAVSL